MWEGFPKAVASCLKSFCSRRDPAYGPQFGFLKTWKFGLKKSLNAVVLTEPQPSCSSLLVQGIFDGYQIITSALSAHLLSTPEGSQLVNIQEASSSATAKSDQAEQVPEQFFTKKNVLYIRDE